MNSFLNFIVKWCSINLQLLFLPQIPLLLALHILAAKIKIKSTSSLTNLNKLLKSLNVFFRGKIVVCLLLKKILKLPEINSFMINFIDTIFLTKSNCTLQKALLRFILISIN